jgi:membrane fusion protein (multidrug efflux system)
MKKNAVIFLLAVFNIINYAGCGAAYTKELKPRTFILEKINGATADRNSKNISYPAYTVNKAVMQALKNNDLIKSATQRIKSVQANFNASTAGMLPKLSFNYNATRLEYQPYLATPHEPIPVFSSAGVKNGYMYFPPRIYMNSVANFNWNAEITQPVFTGFALQGKRELAELGINISKVQRQEAVLNVIEGVKITYFNVLRAQEQLKVAGEQVKSLISHEMQAELLYKQGVIPYNDLLKSEVASADAAQYRALSKTALNIAVSGFKGSQKQIKQISISILVQDSALAKAGYQLKADEALERLDRQNYIRYYNLLKGKAASKLMYDEMATKYRMIQAKVDADKASLTQIAASIAELKSAMKSKAFFAKTAFASYKIAEINLNRTVVYAPVGGYVAKKNVNDGSYVMPGIPYLNIVNLHKIWIVANFKESDIGNIKIGAPVIIKVDSYPKVTFHGVVSSFQSGTGSVFSLLPPENATGNYIKVVQRVPVKINLSKTFYPKTPLYPGLSVEPYVTVEK